MQKNELQVVKYYESYNIFVWAIDMDAWFSGEGKSLRVWHYGLDSWWVMKHSAVPLPFCMALSQSVHWHSRFDIAALSIIIFFLDLVSGDLALTEL